MYIVLCLILYLILSLFFYSISIYLCHCFQEGGDGKPTSLRTTAKKGVCLPIPLESLNLFTFLKMTENEIKNVADLITANIIGTTKEVLTSREASRYLGVSMSYLYKLTMDRMLPHYKPLGKMVYFNRHELEEWLQKNRVNSKDEAKQAAAAYCLRKGGRK